MIGDTSHFNDLFGIDLKCYFVDSHQKLTNAVSQAVEDGCQTVIGGQIFCECARALSLPNRFLPAGEESLRNALETASRVCYAIDMEKRNLSEMDTMLNNTFSGIVQLNRGGRTQRLNRAASVLLNREASEVVGCRAAEVIPNLNGELRGELLQRGYVVKYNFDSIICKSEKTQQLVKTAKQMEKFNAPIFLKGEAGNGKTVIAQCIHKESLNANSAFVSVNCGAWMPETLDGNLFGNYSARKDGPMCLAEMAQNGTLYVSNVECMMLETQYKLLMLIRGKFYHNGTPNPSSASVRVIASTECSTGFPAGPSTTRSPAWFGKTISPGNSAFAGLSQNKRYFYESSITRGCGHHHFRVYRSRKAR